MLSFNATNEIVRSPLPLPPAPRLVRSFSVPCVARRAEAFDENNERREDLIPRKIFHPEIDN